MINGNANMSNNQTIEKYCYDNQEANCDTYGALYQWSEMMNYIYLDGTQGICPDSWHVASISELEALVAFVDEDGNALKAIGQGTGGGAGTNTSGFSAMLTEVRNSTGDGFSGLNIFTTIWSSTEQVTGWAYRTTIGATTGLTQGGVSQVNYGNPVRCIKD